MKRVDLTGQQFGRLTVIRYVGGPQCRWECRCVCGARKDVAGGGLRSGNTQSCGCLHRELASQKFRLDDMTGQRFDRLRVTGFAEMRSGESFWHCACDCGVQTEARGWALRNGSVRSCGCLHREVARAARTDEPTYSAIHSRLTTARGAAKQHSCVDCGGCAEQWSYDHRDHDELTSALGHPYSLDLDHYDPRCCACHRTFDLSHAGSQR